MINRPPTSDEAHATEERQKLFGKLIRIQHSISHGAPLEQVLDSITQGAAELIGDEVVGLRIIDEDDPSYCLLVSHSGVKEELLPSLQRTPVGVGAGGRAIRENKLVILADYAAGTDTLPSLAADGLQSAMAAPVHEKGTVTGSLVVASYIPGRTYSEVEQEALLAFAEHVSLAISDAKMVDALRQAQRQKDLWMAMVSHGLKTPLTVIMGTLHTIEKHHDRLSDQMLEDMLYAARLRAQEMERMIGRLLEGARAELAGTKVDIFVPDLFANVLRGFEESFRVKLKETPAVVVTIDADAVSQLIGILLENAVAHSRGVGEISLEPQIDDEQLTVTVSNQGALPFGIDSKELFKPFQRGVESRTAGVGLGLFIAHQLATAIGGTLEVEEEGGIVAFTLCCPISSPIG